MEVILKQDVEHLGFANDLVKVRDGYARNYLLPRGLAVTATTGERKQLAETLKQRAHKEARLREEADRNASKLAAQAVKIGAKVGEKGRIFGSVNTIMLSDAFKALAWKWTASTSRSRARPSRTSVPTRRRSPSTARW
jgi:large subunit ribosomal protein L9